MAKRICATEGCDKPHRAKGLCSTHYNQTFDPDRHAPAPTPCAACGRVVVKHKAYAGRRAVCSTRCRRFIQFGTWGHEGKELVGPIQVKKSTEAAVTVTPSSGRGFVCCRCANCGDPFVTWKTGRAARYCGQRCARRYGRLWVPDRVRIAIYERDDWTCQICLEPVEPDADPSSDWFPSLDHIECRSWTLTPDHTPSNLRLAHRWCNSVRGDESYYSAASLVAA